MLKTLASQQPRIAKGLLKVAASSVQAHVCSSVGKAPLSFRALDDGLLHDVPREKTGPRKGGAAEPGPWLFVDGAGPEGLRALAQQQL